MKVREILSYVNMRAPLVYFLSKGLAGYVLPAFDNFRYITIEVGDMLGHVDIALHKRALEIKISKQLQGSKHFGNHGDTTV